mmetsp:Transcript_51076/g.119553  ORF Transcript_51076/g.119553 Transcript_51076/m.119553 type:complete len:255 (+) Transcript_51076:1869-2633(+)
MSLCCLLLNSCATGTGLFAVLTVMSATKTRSSLGLHCSVIVFASSTALAVMRTSSTKVGGKLWSFIICRARLTRTMLSCDSSQSSRWCPFISDIDEFLRRLPKTRETPLTLGNSAAEAVPSSPRNAARCFSKASSVSHAFVPSVPSPFTDLICITSDGFCSWPCALTANIGANLTFGSTPCWLMIASAFAASSSLWRRLLRNCGEMDTFDNILPAPVCNINPGAWPSCIPMPRTWKAGFVTFLNSFFKRVISAS